MKECYACGRTVTYKWYHMIKRKYFLCGKCYHHYRVGTFIRQTNQVENRSCYSCGNDKPVGFWHVNYGNNKLEIGALCDNCFQQYINRPRRISMKRRRVALGFTPEKPEKCTQCNEKSKKLDGHHLYYFIIFPWAFRIYLCPSCHNKETIRLEQNNRDKTTGKFIGKKW